MDPKPEWHCRIGKVTRKGGATVRVLRPSDDPSATDVLSALREGVDILAEMFKDDAAGYVIVMWDRAGRYSRARFNAPSSPYARRLIPAIVHDILSEDTMGDVTRNVLQNKE